MTQTKQIFDHFGIEAQKMKLIEEMAELTAELAKNKDELKIMAEIADVSVVLEQIIDYYGREAIENIRQGKIERTLERIKSGYYNPKCQVCSIELDKQAFDAGYGCCEGCFMAYQEQLINDELERDYLNNLYNDDGFTKW
jgi:NTP pyrophosphatase (non-canonical NTP hydrolase)